MPKFKIVFTFFATMLLLAVPNICTAENYTEQTKPADTSFRQSFSKQDLVRKYQKKYFEIIKRNYVLLNIEDDEELNNDRKELENLFNEVEVQITNKNFLKKYKKIQNKFSECDEITTIGINEFAEKNYIATDKFLKSIYKKVLKKSDKQSREQLEFDQKLWEQEVEAYEQVYNSMDFGTIGASIYYDFEINMREFRALLLMLYL